MDHFIYDIECYPNVFTCSFLHHETGYKHTFEISGRVNQMLAFLACLKRISEEDARMVGFNNEAYDYPVLHYIIENKGILDVADIFNKSNQIINTPFERRFDNIIWPRDRHIKQLDLYKIHHFDNVAKRTSLKMLEFQMRRDTIQDLPFIPGSYLGDHEIIELIKYNEKDVSDTHAFFIESLSAIKFRDELSLKYGMDCTNFNDTKIGKSYFAMRLEEVNPGCTKYQTPREFIRLSDIIFPYISFEQPEFNRVLGWMKQQVITETKSAFDDLSAVVNGFQYDFGTGGIHGCCESGFIESEYDQTIIDIDVTSYYPSIAISNKVFPAHLGSKFCDIYTDIKNERLTHKKGTPENAMLKLALNGVYGDSNNRYSAFYDPQYTMTITVNGQLLLCMLAEQLIKIPYLKMIQINTDGLTVKIPHVYEPWMKGVCNWWEELTCLQLEFNKYSRMWVRDVNHYIAENAESGKLKSKGVYMHTGRAWHQNQSALVIQKAVEAYLVNDVPVENFIYGHTDAFDFCLRTNLNRGSKLMCGDRQQQRISRYFVARKTGEPLVKVMPPTPAQKAKDTNAPDRRISVEKGWDVVVCNDMRDFDWLNLNYDYYIQKTFELIKPLQKRIV